MVIEIKHRMSYDRDLMDICDPEQQEAIRELTGRKTVTARDIECLKRLGFKIVDLDQVLRDILK